MDDKEKRALLVNRRALLAVGAATSLGVAVWGRDANAQTVPPGPEVSSASPNKAVSVEGQTVLVTGSNRGIGLGFVQVLLQRGVRKVYATARRPESLSELAATYPDRVVPLQLDVNNSQHRTNVANAATDATWLINNAGVPGSDMASERRIRSAKTLDDARFVMETNCWSPAELSRLFIPIILDNGGGAITNILSVGAWYCVPAHTTYSMSKAAAAMMTAGLRAELDREPMLVSGVFTGGVATRMSEGSGMSPTEHAHQVFDAVAHGETDILAGTGVQRLRNEVRSDPKAVERDRIERFFASQD